MIPDCKNMDDIFKFDGEKVNCIGVFKVSEEKLEPGERKKIFLGSYLELNDGTKVVLGYLPPNKSADKYIDKQVKITGTIHKSIPPENAYMQQVIAPHLKDYNDIEIL